MQILQQLSHFHRAVRSKMEHTTSLSSLSNTPEIPDSSIRYISGLSEPSSELAGVLNSMPSIANYCDSIATIDQLLQFLQQLSYLEFLDNSSTATIRVNL